MDACKHQQQTELQIWDLKGTKICFSKLETLLSLFFSSSLVPAEILHYAIHDLWPFLSANSVNL